ncbi:hypothetical protein CPB86DRAFT_739798 [Serendipita vermifera]|nr:hypothetical protein CPB86DRAFT_739798 [Serendipita vermifera]
MAQPSRPFRALGFFKKKEGISDEDFVRHWKEVHGAIILPFLKKHGALYYSQTHISQANKEALNNRCFGGKAKLLDYDGVITIDWPSIEAAQAYSNDPEYKEAVKGDIAIFTQEGEICFAAGREEIVLDRKS